MQVWFGNLAESKDPGKKELQIFVKRIQEYLGFVLENTEDFGFLWEDDEALRDLALETFRGDVSESGEMLNHAIPGISSQQINAHGLRGRALRFKFAALASIEKKWDAVKGKSAIRGWFKQMRDAIDAILDSLISASGGVGGVIKEFKDALSALAKTT